ncbi:hypothetical protein PsorP6_011613 [Peronosclerospora sorghi]|uniref:Uncharacterized protein n=1 Tax=Peronosclerospora sorghi TaxID=230839 RepID=A0ACC0WJW1_9STRA|nr:hypothetical protein PsorP6_011613 [Peronosclerospora sorghi]
MSQFSRQRASRWRCEVPPKYVLLNSMYENAFSEAIGCIPSILELTPSVWSQWTNQCQKKVDDPYDGSSERSEDELTFAAAPNGVQHKEVSDDNINIEECTVTAGENVCVTAGTMVCVEGQDDVGFVTALNLKFLEKETSIQQVVRFVTKKFPNVELLKLQQILNTRNVGFVLNKLMVNLPYQLVSVLHSALHEAIEWAAKNEHMQELRSSLQMDYFLILATCTEMKSKGGGSNRSKKMKTTYKQITNFFQNFQDEFLEQEAEVTFAI